MSESRKFSYDPIASTYASRIDQAPHNALYERPAMFSIMPDVQGKTVLDAGCGNGWYAEQMLSRGARVDAIDASAAMVDYARNRLSSYLGGEGNNLSLKCADLMEPLPFHDQQFDGIVSPLVLHYIADWRPTLREMRRVLKPDGWLLFSTHHPGTEMARYAPENYFEVQHIVDNWKWLGNVEFYRRPLSEISSALSDAQFLIDRIVEPIPTEQFKRVKPESYADLMRQPEFLIVLARPR
jgi:SAM-dependent methyltransferase